VVLYTSDHGDFQAAHGLIFKGPIHVDSVVRVPFIWVDPNDKKAVNSTPALSSTLDLAQTILDRAKVEPSNGIQGHSLLNIVSGLEEKARDAVLIEESGQRTILNFKGPVRARTAIGDRWRLTIYHNEDYAELFDLENDPDEMINLWDDPAQRETKLEMMELLARLQLEHGDLSRLPDKLA
jgi:arylsulfatase A-like enzyme